MQFRKLIENAITASAGTLLYLKGNEGLGQTQSSAQLTFNISSMMLGLLTIGVVMLPAISSRMFPPAQANQINQGQNQINQSLLQNDQLRQVVVHQQAVPVNHQAVPVVPVHRRRHTM